MTHMITISGAEYHFFGPGALRQNGRPISIQDIAHHLSLINRFTGATTRPYSVAEHSLLCCEIAQRAGGSLIVQLAALMHDAHEAYTTDLSSPAKVAVNSYSMGTGGVAAWSLFEDEHAKAVHEHFGLLTVMRNQRKLIRQIDLQALATERRDLTAYDARHGSPWAVLRDESFDPITPILWVCLSSPAREAMTWKQWRQAFLDRFLELRIALDLGPKGVVPPTLAAGMTC